MTPSGRSRPRVALRRGPRSLVRLVLAVLVVAAALCSTAPRTLAARAGATRTTTTPSLTGSFPLGRRRLSHPRRTRSRARPAPAHHSSGLGKGTSRGSASGRGTAPSGGSASGRGTAPSRTPASGSGTATSGVSASGRGRSHALVLTLTLVIAPIGAAIVLVFLVVRALRLPREVPPRPRRGRRPRHPVPPPIIWLLTPVFRYSATRRAYVMRVVGSRRGPVLVTREGSRLGRRTKVDRS